MKAAPKAAPTECKTQRSEMQLPQGQRARQGSNLQPSAPEALAGQNAKPCESAGIEQKRPEIASERRGAGATSHATNTRTNADTAPIGATEVRG